MWDQPPSGYPVASSPRIIPTYVGSTSSDASSPSVPSNHSHVCGINAGVRSPWRFCNESFPRMWDQPRRSFSRQLLERIIPTYVGSTYRDSSCISSAPNHSHVCGINRKALFRTLHALESFPRMWDQRFIVFTLLSSRRIIPTYVGSTSRNDARTSFSVESFPRMWDQQLHLDFLQLVLRIIPTYVGSTRSLSR